MTIAADMTLPFEARAQVYGLLASLYITPPNAQLLEALQNPTFVADWPLGRGLPDVEAGLACLAGSLAGLSAEALQEEFWHLFGTLGPADAPPWQSFYLDPEQAVMGEETLRVRALFGRFGLAFAHAGQAPDDHLGLELEFLAALARRLVESLGAGDESAARSLLDGQRECLEEHLLRWFEDFVSRVEAASDSGFYAGLSRLTLGLLRDDLSEVRRLLAAPALI